MLTFLFLFGIHSISVYSGWPGFGLGKLAMLIQFLGLVYALYFVPPTTQIKIVLAMSFIGIDYPLLLMPIFLLPKMLLGNKSTDFSKFKPAHKALLAFLGYAMLLIIPTSFMDFSPLNNMFWMLTFGSGIFTFFYYSKFKYSRDQVNEIFEFVKKMIILQLILIFVQAAIYYSIKPGDWGMGSFKDAHKVALYTLLLLLYYYLPILVKRKSLAKALLNARNILGLTFLAVCLVLVDGKLVYLCFALGIIFFFTALLYRNVKSKVPNISTFKLSSILVIALVLILNLPVLFNFYISNVFESRKSLDYYVEHYGGENKRYSHKSTFYSRVFGTMLRKDPLLWTFGVGPGKLGSRASNTLAYDVLHKDNQKIPSFIPAHSTIWVRQYMADLWTTRISDQMKNGSSTLANPFSGIVTIKGEMGLVGLLIFLITAFYFGTGMLKMISRDRIRKVDRWRMAISCFWFSLPLLAIVDNYTEKPQIMIPLFLMSCVLFNTESAES